MTKLVIDPLSLSQEFPDASETNSVKIKLLAQVVEYDSQSAILKVTRMVNMPTFCSGGDGGQEDQEGISGVTSDEHESMKSREQASQEAPKQYHTLSVNMFNVINSMTAEMTYKGSAVSLIGFFNGESLNVVDCYSFNSSFTMLRQDIQTIMDVRDLQALN
ncbi:Piso0_000117 [Millerozyma farinosa CBS 7064]|uniref:Piso0_000117 protein n=1 Tax=Pichia sorbitophila (strain ATCC MYA-4447 / BCRC 22081 / CBS 7064 / NBRC 10061 / NRRL Y-12695) TaxID=559304 RepID=G8YT47_PICSO|nr:Piso0_000117 [Millerozyma farinosa CBS 7064]